MSNPLLLFLVQMLRRDEERRPRRDPVRAAAASAARASIAGWLPPTAISTRRGLRSSGFGIRTSRTPLSNVALTASGFTPSGSVSDRLKRPNERSTRYQPRSRSSCSDRRSPDTVSVFSSRLTSTSSGWIPGNSTCRTNASWFSSTSNAGLQAPAVAGADDSPPATPLPRKLRNIRSNSSWTPASSRG